MKNKFSGIYRTESTRLQNWNYSWRGKYFITVCTQKRANYFGEIIEGKINLTEIGLETETQWLKSVELRPEMNLSLGEFQIMPNHFHGIIEIGRNNHNDYINMESNSDCKKFFGPQSKTLGSIIRGFKGAVTTHARINKILFDWQPRFHDHLIRNDLELLKIQKYIQNNIRNWSRDRFNKSR